MTKLGWASVESLPLLLMLKIGKGLFVAFSKPNIHQADKKVLMPQILKEGSILQILENLRNHFK